MTIKEAVMNCRAGETFNTELLYTIASARAQGNDFLKLVLAAETKEYVQLQKQLKVLKKQGKVQIYIVAHEFYGASKEARYLRNKYPTLSEFCTDGETNMIIKL